MEDLEITETSGLTLLPFSEPMLRKVPEDFDFEKEDPKELKEKLLEKMRDL